MEPRSPRGCATHSDAADPGSDRDTAARRRDRRLLPHRRAQRERPALSARARTDEGEEPRRRTYGLGARSRSVCAGALTSRANITTIDFPAARRVVDPSMIDTPQSL